MTATALDPLRFALRGSRLIEASAGTGKTFTIAALYLRLVLGHGAADEAFSRPLTPPEILVVTFTDAATKELRDRIRARLAEAAEYFLTEPRQVRPRPQGEDLLHDLRAQYPLDAWPGCARRLQLAAQWMDEAAVSTIHGWCNRMLREHAFDSGSLFTQHLETDQSQLLAEVVRDYWRCFMVPLDQHAARRVASWWASPAALQEAVAALLPHVGRLASAPAPLQALAAADAAHAQHLVELKAPWREWVDELQALIDDARERKLFDARKLNRASGANWLGALAAWRDDPAQVQPALTATAWQRLTPDGLQAIWKDDAEPPRHPALDALCSLRDALGELPTGREDLLRHAAHWVATQFELERERRAQMGFDDLLTRLDDALAGPNGARLASVIRAQFPVALIDEFQDTDAVQYRVFNAIYRVRDNDQDTALVLIGDPKQAIYAFRGADIHTYLAARADTAGRLYTLRRNFRSTQAMVEATNRCFDAAEQRPGPGAFLFRTDSDDPVPFLAASAHGRDDALLVEGQAAPALTVWRLAESSDGQAYGKGAYIEDMAQVCASEMVRLLNLAQRGQAAFAGANGAVRPLQPGDMAVLVNNRAEAAAIRQALDKRGVRSVYLSERDSVYQRPEALEMQRWLAACAAPQDGRALRAALATPTLALDWATLDRLNHDEAAWDGYVLQFRGYQECWRRQGVLPMLRRLLHDFRVPARLLGAGSGGERRLTDLLHLAELLQHASSALDGEHALIRHLAEQRQQGAGAGGDARQVRLESDADLVQVITIHKSKGLEYPLVFLPFACSFRATRKGDTPLKWHDEQGRLQLDLAGQGATVAAADRERLGEDLRKLYVALTRARYATWIGTAPVEGLGQCAFGHLVGGELRAGVDALARGCEHIHLIDDPEPTDDRFAGQAPPPAAGGARVPERRLHENWWIASYSALHTADRGGADTAQEEVFREAAAAHATPSVPLSPRSSADAGPSAGLLHGFPRGAAVGTFLHDLLEWAANQGFARIVASPELLRDMVARRCAVRGWQSWIEPLCAWLQDLLQRPLAVPDAPPLTLATLGSVAAEMEFWVGVHAVDTARLDALVCRHTLSGARRAPLQPLQLNGMVRGFIDLVAEHDGRYYVVDYKSNWLGSDDGAYAAPALRREVAERRYELQYALYLLALHRLLRLRLPDYDYDRHVGGALCLFLRGSQANGGGVHAERPPRVLIEALDRLFTRCTPKEAA